MRVITITGRPINFSEFLPYSKIFIETGTCNGRSVTSALNCGFERVKSVELFQKWFDYSKEIFWGNPKVELFFGKSTDLLPEMLSDITEPCVFWLDAHPSCPDTAGY